MDSSIEALIKDLLLVLESEERFILGLLGPPASGKSTLAGQLVDQINRDGSDRAVVLPMDGFHLSDEKLSEMGLLRLKGIPQSFDADAFVSLVESVKLESEREHLAPEFRREIEASIEDAIKILPHHKIVIVEGNYLLLDEEPWSRLADCFNEVCYLLLDDSIRQGRLLKRHMENGRSEEEAKKKIRTTDDPNTELVESTKSRASRIVVVN